MDGRTDGRTNNPEAICPSNFLEVGGIITCNRVTVLALCTITDGHLSMYQVSFDMHQTNSILQKLGKEITP